MKELSIEEKAKRYDEAIERAKSLLSGNQLGNAWIYKLLPELKESEDERIRKALIRFHKSTINIDGIKGADVIAWLEKQGEQKYIPKYKIGDYVKNTNYKGEPIYEIVYMDKECYICEYRGKERMGDKAVMHFSFDNPYLRLVQKPADKVAKPAEEYNITGIKSKNAQGKLGEMIKNLKSVNEVLEQKPAEWSEEIEAAISLLKHIAEEQEKDYCPHNANALRKAAQYLESIRPQSQWKPSDEQMGALWDSIKHNLHLHPVLESLYNDLKKLK